MATSFVRRALLLGAAATLIAGLGVGSLATAAVAKPASTPQSISFEPPPQTMKSTTHKKLHVQLFADATDIDSTHFASADVSVSRKGTPEFHTWSFDLTAGSLKFSPSTGKGSLKAGSQLKPYAMITLHLAAIGKKTSTSCKGSKTVSQPVSVHGVFSFNTHTSGKHGWGKVGGTAKRIFKGSSIIVYQIGTFELCHSTPPACSTAVSWTATKEGTGVNELSFSGVFQKAGGKEVKSLSVTRNTGLAKPANAVREDRLYLPSARMSFTESKAGIVSVHIRAHGIVTGSASIVSPSGGSSYTEGCGKSKTQHTTNWVAQYKNGKSPLTVPEQIEGNFRIPNLTGSIDRLTVS